MTDKIATRRTEVAAQIRDARNRLGDEFTGRERAKLGKIILRYEREANWVPEKETLGMHWPVRAVKDGVCGRYYDKYGESVCTIWLFYRDMDDEEVAEYAQHYYRGPGRWFGLEPWVKRAPGRTLIKWRESMDV